LVAGSANETLRHNGADWVASSTLYNNGTNVGVGTTSPGAPLHVNTTGSSEIARFESTAGSNWIGMYKSGVRQGILWNSGSTLSLQNDNASGSLRFNTNGFNPRMTITSTGDVGIGTTSPSGEFEVASSGETNVIFDRGSSASANVIEMSSGGSTDWTIMTPSGQDYLKFSNGSGTGLMTMTQGGGIGIATDSPTGRLDVQGDASSTSSVSSFTTNYTGNSDIRAVNAVSTPADGYGYGIDATGGYRGVQGTGAGGAYTGTTIGVRGYASGTAGTRTGVYGYASNSGGTNAYGVYGLANGATNNWAGYFSSGNVYIANELRIGLTGGATGYDVAVDGKIICEELKVQDSGSWPDYVFADEYELKTLEEVEAHIEANSHLPGVPDAATVEEDGIMIGEMQKVMMEKIEELTLYMIDANKRIKALEAENSALKATK
jgi:hypothetical protein